MRAIPFLFFILCITAPALSQKPSQKEIAAQKQEALNDARQQVAELKKEIADAKTKKEDPESIRELEKQLATLENMVAMLETAFSPGRQVPKTLGPPKTAEPKYISPFVPIALNQNVTAPTKDNAKDHLLWYTGKKIDANTLITVSGVIVRYDRQRNLVIVQTDKRVDTPYYGLVNTLAQTPQMKSQFSIGMFGLTNSFMMWPEIKKAYDEYNFFKNRYHNLAKNTTDLPPVNSTISQDPSFDRNLISLEDDLLMYLNLLTPLRGIVLPPKRPNDLCKCDGDEREIYEDDLGNWLDQFYAEEIRILHLLKAIFVHIAYREKLGYATVVKPYLKQDYILAFNKVLDRSRQKLLELSLEYQAPEIYVEEGLVMATLSLQKLLIHTFGDIDEPVTISLKRDAFTVIDKVKGLIMQNKVFENYMKDQLFMKNYNVVFDYSLYIAHEYNKKLLSPSYRIEENFFQNWVEALRKFNRFTLSINLDFEYRLEGSDGKTKWIATGSLESKKIVVSLGRSTCKWHLFISDVNQAGLNSNEDSFYVAMKVTSGIKTIFRDPDPPLIFNYSGPGKMAMVFPNFEITFCNSGQPDSVLMDKLRYTDADTKAYMAAHPKIDFGKEYSLDMFQYVNKMFVSVLTVKDNSNALVTTAGDMMNIQSLTQMPSSTGNQNLDKLMMDYVMNQKRRSLQQSMTPIVNSGQTVIPFDAINGSPVLIQTIHSTADPNDPDRLVGIKMTKSLVTIKAEHTPL